MNSWRTDGRSEGLFILGRLCERFGLGDTLRYIEEISDAALTGEFERTIAKSAPSFATKKFDSVFAFRLYRLALYALVREVKPQNVIETGVLHGMTSAFLLEALERNGNGTLFSIDLPSPEADGPANQDGIHAVLPASLTSGWIVPERLRHRWRLTLGSSQEKLPEIFRDTSEIDIFLHDSDHTYSIMWDELVLAWSHLRVGGYLVCDNVDFSRAFFDLCRRVERVPFVLSAPDDQRHAAIRFAIIKK